MKIRQLRTSTELHPPRPRTRGRGRVRGASRRHCESGPSPRLSPEYRGEGSAALVRAAVLLFICSVGSVASAQVNIPFEKLRTCTDDSANWLTHNGNYSGHRYSKLD